MSMESLSPPSSTFLGWEYFLVRPVLAVAFVLSFISLWWWLAWKLVMVHVPLVQEIFGLRRKPVRPKPPSRRISRYNNSINAPIIQFPNENMQYTSYWQKVSTAQAFQSLEGQKRNPKEKNGKKIVHLFDVSKWKE